VFACKFGFPAGSPGGVWRLESVNASGDLSSRRLDRFEIEAAHLRSDIYVRGPLSDYIPPTLAGFSMSPDSVRTVFDLVTIDVAAADADSGIAEVRTTLSNGSATLGCSTKIPMSGTIHDGVFRCVMPIAGFIQSEHLQVQSVQVRDRNGNVTEQYGGELESRGFPTMLKVQPDTVPPTVAAFSISPTTVAANGVDSVSIALTGADPWSGVQLLELEFRRTSDSSPRNCIAGFSYAARASRTLRCALRFNPGAQGTWRLHFIRIADSAGRALRLDAAQAQAAGLPTEFTVTP
jgi:hypothetical protein